MKIILRHIIVGGNLLDCFLKRLPKINEIFPMKRKNENDLRKRIYFLWGRDKRAYIAVTREAKIYPPRQAAAAAIYEPQSMRTLGISWIAAAYL